MTKLTIKDLNASECSDGEAMKRIRGGGLRGDTETERPAYEFDHDAFKKSLYEYLDTVWQNQPIPETPDPLTRGGHNKGPYIPI